MGTWRYVKCPYAAVEGALCPGEVIQIRLPAVYRVTVVASTQRPSRRCTLEVAEMGKKMNSEGQRDIELRLRTIAEMVRRDLPPHPPRERTPDEQHTHLLEESQQLYENELAWEEETGEESTGEGAVVALVFPGTLALVDALVTSHAPTELGEGGPHRDVVASFLVWLSERLSDLRSGRIRGSATDRAKEADLTDRLIDLILHRYCGLSVSEVERLDAARN